MRMRYPETFQIKENAGFNLLVHGEGQLLAHCAANTLAVDKSHCHLLGISIQWEVKRRQVYPYSFIMHILSMCQNCKLCRNNMVIDGEIESKIKRALTHNITKDYKD